MKAAAQKACAVPTPPPGAQTETVNVPAGGPPPPPVLTTVPPLVSLELHGNGGVAVLADDKATAYCMLRRDGDQFTLGSLMVSSADGSNGMVSISTSGVGGGPGTESGPSISGGGATSIDVPGSDTPLIVSAMSTTFGSQATGIIASSAPAAVASVRIDGGPANGGTATVDDGHFAMWVPFALGNEPIKVVALDASGNEIASATLFDPQQPIRINTNGS